MEFDRDKLLEIIEMYSNEALRDICCPNLYNPKQVKCIHCGSIYNENECVYEKRKDTILWWCKNPKCDGAGVS